MQAYFHLIFPAENKNIRMKVISCLGYKQRRAHDYNEPHSQRPLEYIPRKPKLERRVCIYVCTDDDVHATHTQLASIFSCLTPAEWKIWPKEERP